MPSLLNKILHPSTSSSRKHNPYISPQHPNNPGTPQPAPASTTARHIFSTSPPQQTVLPPPPRPASPREPYDYLAEAREASGRDPVTGQPRDQNVQSSSDARGEGRTGRSVYQETSGGRSRTPGTKYDLYVQEMKARKGGRWRAPEGGFYAPERRVGEFYQPERGGGQGYGR